MIRAAEIALHFDSWDLDAESLAYLRLQSPRYEFLLKQTEKLIARTKGRQGVGAVKILDIGPAYQTELLRQRFAQTTVNTLGFEDIRFKPRKSEWHYQLDLNTLQDELTRPKLERHHLVIMAEVVEHLYICPKFILQSISDWLQDKGYLLIQTPNAVRLSRRLKALSGENPQEMIRQTPANPGHFREYTGEELISLAKEAGFYLISHSCHNYFNAKSSVKIKLYNIFCSILPGNLRDELFICLQKA